MSLRGASGLCEPRNEAIAYCTGRTCIARDCFFAAQAVHRNDIAGNCSLYTMSYKFFYLFLAGGILGLLILIYQIVTQYPKIETVDAVFNAILVIVFFYMAYKV